MKANNGVYVYFRHAKASTLIAAMPHKIVSVDDPLFWHEKRGSNQAAKSLDTLSLDGSSHESYPSMSPSVISQIMQNFVPKHVAHRRLRMPPMHTPYLDDPAALPELYLGEDYDDLLTTTLIGPASSNVFITHDANMAHTLGVLMGATLSIFAFGASDIAMVRKVTHSVALADTNMKWDGYDTPYLEHVSTPDNMHEASNAPGDQNYTASPVVLGQVQ